MDILFIKDTCVQNSCQKQTKNPISGINTKESRKVQTICHIITEKSAICMGLIPWSRRYPGEGHSNPF